ncbi:MAG TPA: AAA family ATPase, partial [Solirubrobacteraceae bacterium]
MAPLATHRPAAAFRSDLPSAPRDAVVERERELAELEAAVAAAQAGAGRVVVVEGEAGMGKSRLLTVARSMARESGLRVLAARGLEHERDVAFGVALALLAPALRGTDATRQASLLAGPAAPAASLLAGRAAANPIAGADRGHALVHALAALVGNLTAPSTPEEEPGPLLICLDDAQWADASSLRCLAYLAAHVEGLPVALAVASRLHRAGTQGQFIDGLATTPGARALRLRPLSEAGVDRLVRAVYAEATPAFSRACATTTQGNPFYLRELLASAQADGLAATDEGAGELAGLVPESVLRSVLMRMAALPPDARELASALAVLGDEAPLRLAGALAELGDGPRAEEAADALARARLVAPGDPLAFTHPLLRTAIHADLPALGRSRAHRRAAALLDADRAPAEAVATHLLAARP